MFTAEASKQFAHNISRQYRDSLTISPAKPSSRILILQGKTQQLEVANNKKIRLSGLKTIRI